MRTLLAVLIATVLQMGWGFVSWGVLADRLQIVRGAPVEEPVRAALRTLPEKGAYFVPIEGYGTEDWAQRHRAGPVALLFVHPAGVEPAMGNTLAEGAAHFLASALLLVALLRLVGPPATFAARFGLIVAIAFFAAFVRYGADAVWWYVPGDYAAFGTIVMVVSWALAGLPIAALVRTRT